MGIVVIKYQEQKYGFKSFKKRYHLTWLVCSFCENYYDYY